MFEKKTKQHKVWQDTGIVFQIQWENTNSTLTEIRICSWRTSLAFAAVVGRHQSRAAGLACLGAGLGIATCRTRLTAFMARLGACGTRDAQQISTRSVARLRNCRRIQAAAARCFGHSRCAQRPQGFWCGTGTAREGLARRFQECQAFSCVRVLGFSWHLGRSLQKALPRIPQHEGGTVFGCLAFFDAGAETFSCCEGSFQKPLVSSKVYKAGIHWGTSVVNTCQTCVTARAGRTEFKIKIELLKGEITPPQSLGGTTLNTAGHPRTIKRARRVKSCREVPG